MKAKFPELNLMMLPLNMKKALNRKIYTVAVTKLQYAIVRSFVEEVSAIA
jgi:hypothetical protein